MACFILDVFKEVVQDVNVRSNIHYSISIFVVGRRNICAKAHYDIDCILRKNSPPRQKVKKCPPQKIKVNILQPERKQRSEISDTKVITDVCRTCTTTTIIINFFIIVIVIIECFQTTCMNFFRVFN